MTARIIRFPGPGHYPHDIEGVTVSRTRDGWMLRRTHAGRIVEMHGLSAQEIRDLHSSLELALEHLEG